MILPCVTAGNGNKFQPIPTIDFNFEIKTSNFDRSPAIVKKRVRKIINSPVTPEVDRCVGNETEKYLVFLCTGYGQCGGWGDRQEGLVFAYVLSRLLNRCFKIFMPQPCKLSKFYQPNKVQWDPKNEHYDQPTKNNTLDASNFRLKDLNDLYPQTFVYFRGYEDLYERFVTNPHYIKQIEEWNGIRDIQDRFFWSWNQLMKPSASFLSKVENIVGGNFLKRKGVDVLTQSPPKAPLCDVSNSTLICAHVRIGKNPNVPKDDVFSSVKLADIPVLFEFMSSKDTTGNAMFFVATDYVNLRIQAYNYFRGRVLDFGAKIVHTDRPAHDDDQCGGFEDALVDQFLLSLCDVLVLCRSGFSRMAFYMRNSIDPVYIFEHGVVILYEE
ncbi:uncharacterized protein LOC131935463 [Physella acuta]|uniref:uncharacterized protein LOC131935463 n=1 Tax=Physella acuta TaxID=109671 RepID=UPI0027DCD0D9|nr:uncharacterized protein LOC131935463 [Physella acuta]